MATKSRSFLKAKRYLDRQAAGGRPARAAVQRTLDHLRNCNVVLNEDIKEVKINLVGPDHLNFGGKRFHRENFPQLKFKNPHVQFSYTKRTSKAPELVVIFANGTAEKIPTLEKEPSQIMEELVKLAGQFTTRKYIAARNEKHYLD